MVVIHSLMSIRTYFTCPKWIFVLLKPTWFRRHHDSFCMAALISTKFALISRSPQMEIIQTPPAMFIYMTWYTYPSIPCTKVSSELKDASMFWWYKNNTTLDHQLLVSHPFQVGNPFHKVANAWYTLSISSILIIKFYQYLSIIIMVPKLFNLLNSQNLQNSIPKGKFGFYQTTSPNFGSCESHNSYPIFPSQK